jgi:signal transduction histidine kinase
LTAGLAHEIGTPLNIIGGRAEYLLRRPRTPAETHENLGIIRSQIDRIVGIVRQLLEFSRRKEPTLRMVDLHSLLKEVTGLLQHKIDEKNIEVRMFTAGPLPTIMADPDLLQQVFINLYLNSLDVLDAGDRIEIRAETEDRSRLRISFEDNGPGIPPEEIGQVFDPFYTTKDVGEGTGLGLSVTYGIVRDHGGDIKVESEPGRFTRFIIRLPLLDGTQPTENERLLM